jgi:oxygen-independent coproporphyrinogen-3 oxidase
MTVADRSLLFAAADQLYDAYRLDDLPRALQRNSLDYYYLSIYPSLVEMRLLDPAAAPPYPSTVANAYVHVPFCSGVCDFCSYYLVAVNPKRRAAIARYLEHVKAEFDYHARHTTFDITCLYFGGGTPSLIPPDALEGFLGFLAERRYLNPMALGTLEVHPEFFADETAAAHFLSILKRHGIGRISVGYQASDDDLLRDRNRRHTTGFVAEAMALLRDAGFLINLDVMYGLPDQFHTAWETTLRDATDFAPDSISTYYLFVDRGTGLHERVRRGQVALPSHRHIQTQHLMAQLALETAGYTELPNDFWARGVADPANFRQERLPSAAITLPIGPGAYGHYSSTQLCNVFDLREYERRMAEGHSPLWRGYQLSPDKAFYRDVMFSFKNDPFIDCSLFQSAYNRNPLELFAATFERLIALGLVEVTGERITLTPKGRLCVEEIGSLFRHPAIDPAEMEMEWAGVLAKHNFAATYPAIEW